MRRRDFIRSAGIMGLGGLGLSNLISSCSPKSLLDLGIDTNFSGDVLIIGAGAAGIAAGYALNQYGINFQILEASNKYGGRVAKENADGFIWDSGAEWIHDQPTILAEILGDAAPNETFELLNYAPNDVKLWDGTELRNQSGFSSLYSEYKFKNSGWYDFLGTYMLPDLIPKIKLIAAVTEIDYSDNRIQIKDIWGETYAADRVICTVPLTIYQEDLIQFIPSWPQEKLDALNQVQLPDGIKALFTAEEKFYPDLLGFGNLSEFVDGAQGEKLYYDAAFGREEGRNFLALFSVGEIASAYTQITDYDDIKQYLYDELADIFGNDIRDKVSVWHVQNWSQQPWIRGSYTHYEDYDAQIILGEPLEGKVYFAGEAFAPVANATVHGAIQSAYITVERMLTEA